MTRLSPERLKNFYPTDGQRFWLSALAMATIVGGVPICMWVFNTIAGGRP